MLYASVSRSCMNGVASNWRDKDDDMAETIKSYSSNKIFDVRKMWVFFFVFPAECCCRQIAGKFKQFNY